MLKLFALKSRYFDFYTMHEQFPFMKVRLWHIADISDLGRELINRLEPLPDTDVRFRI